MSPTKRARFMLEEESAGVGSFVVATTTSSSNLSPKRLRGGGGGGPLFNSYAKTNQKPSVIAEKITKNRPSHDDGEETKPSYYVSANGDEDEYMDEIQEEEDLEQATLPVVTSAVFSDITESIRRRWLRPPNQVLDNSNDLSLQWLDMDLLGGKPLEQNPNETLQDRRVCGAGKGQVPIIRAYGVTEAGNSVTVFIHGYTPYGFFALPDGAEYDETYENKKKLIMELDKRLDGAARGTKLEKYCHRVKYVKDKKSIMGYETNHRKFFCITVAMPTLIPTLKRILEDGIDLPGVSTTNGNNQYAAFECNVPFVLRYMIDRDIAGAGWMTLSKKTYQVRDASKSQTHSQVSPTSMSVPGISCDGNSLSSRVNLPPCVDIGRNRHFIQ
jgi:hypothetical protein